MRRILITTLVCLLTLTCVSYASITVCNGLDEGHYFDETALCNGQTPGNTKLSPLTYNFPTQMWDGNLLSALREKCPKDKNGNNFTYEFATQELNGDLWIDAYFAFHWPECTHGARLTANYDKKTGDPDIDLCWIQLVTDVGSSFPSGGRVNAIDGGTKDGNGNIVDPKYFPDGTDISKYTFPKDKTYTGTVFGDSPRNDIPHDEAKPYWYTGRFMLLLAGRSGNTFTIYEKIYWGYDAVCTPEPATMLSLALGTLAMLRRKQK